MGITTEMETNKKAPARTTGLIRAGSTEDLKQKPVLTGQADMR